MGKYLATICIPTTRSEDAIYDCLDSLETQSNKSFQVIIVSKSKTKNVATQARSYSYPISKVIQKREGLVGAMNDGLDKTKTEYFIRIDDDVTLDKRWFEHIILPFKKKNVGGVTGPTLIDKTRLKERDVFAFLTQIKKNNLLRKLIIEYLYENKIFEVSTFLKSGVFTLGSNFKEYIPKKSVQVNNFEACNFAVRTNLLKKLGGFDDVFAKGLGEYHEADIAMKIQKAGYSILFHPKAIAHHTISRDSGTTRKDAYHRIQNFIHFYKRHFIIDSLDDLMRFSTNLLVQNCYYVYTGIKRRDISQFGSLLGTLKGLLLTKIV
ncbi:MAG: glycosyltransferase family 2 protein [bacterium]|nr:glycosyltransferase family 2 protein [bacterium]